MEYSSSSSGKLASVLSLEPTRRDIKMSKHSRQEQTSAEKGKQEQEDRSRHEK
jgi:hypothetical protein